MLTGTLWLKKREESTAGKSGSSNRTPCCKHSCLSSSKDFPSDWVSMALLEPEPLPDSVDWRGIFFTAEARRCEVVCDGARCLLCVWSTDETVRSGRAGTHPPDRNWFVLPRLVNLAPADSLSLSLCWLLSLSLFLSQLGLACKKLQEFIHFLTLSFKSAAVSRTILLSRTTKVYLMNLFVWGL